jgi:hypothetical protein
MNPKIQNLQKQNDAIYSSLVSKNVLFTRYVISDINDETKILEILTEENKELKELSKNNRPAPQVVEKKPVTLVVEKKEPIPKEPKTNDDCDDEESFEESKKSYTIIHNMEDIKRAFFNKEYELFEELVKQNEFIYYKVSYKYSSDNDNKPDYIARNLLKGFGRSLDDYRKYLLVCFRCKEYEPKKYEYNSLWIVNTKDDLKTVIGSFYDDFDFQLQTFDVENSMSKFLEEFRKKDLDVETNVIGETYIH